MNQNQVILVHKNIEYSRIWSFLCLQYFKVPFAVTSKPEDVPALCASSSFNLIFIDPRIIDPNKAKALGNGNNKIFILGDDADQFPKLFSIGKLLDVFSNAGASHDFSLFSYHIALAVLPLFQIIGAFLMKWVKDEHRVLH